MTQDEIIIAMAREAGFISIADWSKVDKEFERFYQMAFAAGAAHEREACAKVCEEHDKQCTFKHGLGAAIRVRGEK